MKKKLIISIISLAIMLASSICVYAYYTSVVLNKTVDVTYTPKIEYVDITTETEFYSLIDEMSNDSSKDYNLSNKVSETRTYYKFTSAMTIKVTNNIVITKDCSIDFGRSTIDLNGFNLIVKHPYVGVIKLTNGKIVNNKADSTSKMIIDTFNSYVDYSGLDTTSDKITIINEDVDDARLLKGALQYALYNLQNTQPLAIDNLYDVDTLSINSSNCQFSGCTKTNCIYTYDDLDFVNHYLGYDVDYTYTSSDSALSSYGDVDNSTTKVVTLTINATTPDGNSSSIDVTVHIINPTVKADMTKASLSVLLNYLNIYYDSTNSNYVFTGKVMLPTYDSYFDCNYSYAIGVSSDSLSLGSSDDTDSPYFIEENDYYILTPTNIVKALEVTTSDATDSTIKSSSSLAVEIISDEEIDNNDITSSLISSYFPGRVIEVEKENTEYKITPNNINLMSEAADNGIKNISSVSYQITQDDLSTYSISVLNDTATIKVVGNEANNNEPNILQNAQLAVTFNFTSGKPQDSLGNSLAITEYIPIKYIEDSSSGDSTMVSSFRPYYLYYNRYILDEVGDKTYNDFTVPFNLDDEYPIYYLTYTFTNTEGTAVTMAENPVSIYLVDKDNNIATGTKITSETLLSWNTNETLDSNVVELLDDELYWYIDIDQSKLLDTDTILNLTYNYKNDSSEKNFTPGGTEMVTKVGIHGIVRCGTNEGFTNSTLYKIIFEIFYPDETYDTNKYLITSDIAKNPGNGTIGNYYKNGVLTFAGNTTIDSFKGINYLTGIEKLNLSNAISCTLSTTEAPAIPDIEYIAQMSSLKELNLSNNGLSDQMEPSTGNTYTAMPGDYNNNFIAELQALTKLEVLDLSKNQIYSFEDLRGITSLREVNVTGNSFTAKFSILGIDLSSTFTGLANSVHGSNGATNISVFTALIQRGVNVIGYDVGQAESVAGKIVKSMSSIEYQEKLHNDVTMLEYIKEFTIYTTATNNSYDLDINDFADIPHSYRNNINFTSSNGATLDELSPNFVIKAIDENTFSLVLTYNYEVKYFDLSSLSQKVEPFSIEFEVAFDVERYS